MSDDFPAFALFEEHEALREAVRALADDKIAPVISGSFWSFADTGIFS